MGVLKTYVAYVSIVVAFFVFCLMPFPPTPRIGGLLSMVFVVVFQNGRVFLRPPFGGSVERWQINEIKGFRTIKYFYPVSSEIYNCISMSFNLGFER
jgi:hypothetical protein